MLRADSPWRRELRDLLSLSGPLILGQVGNQAMSFVDAVMVGRLGPAPLAGIGIGNGIYFAITLIGMGCVFGMDPLVSQALGAGEEARARQTLREGVRLAVLVGLPTMLLILASPALVQAAGVDAEAAVEVRRFLYGRFANVIPFLVFIAQRSYLQAKHATRPILVAVVAANIANFVFNVLLIYGDDGLARVGLPRVGLPPLGVFGSGLSSTLASIMQMGVLALAIRSLPLAVPVSSGPAPEIMWKMLRVGLPLGLQLLAEVGVFAVAGVLIGRLGTLPAAGNQVAITLASATFNVTVGIGAATAVRVGYHIGRKDTPGARRAGQCGMVAGTAFMMLTALAFLVIPGPLARILTDDPAVIAAAVPLILVASVFQISDGLQAVSAGALRGAGDSHVSLIANVIGHWAVGLPIAVVLGFWLHLGAAGLWWGLSAGLTAVAIALVTRFLRISSREIRRV